MTRRVWRSMAGAAGLVLGLVASSGVRASSVALHTGSMALAPETVQLLIGRENGSLPGGPGVRVGDVIHVLYTVYPVANGATVGVNGYSTIYVPPELSVIDAAIVDAVTNSTFGALAPRLPAPMADGWGALGSSATPAGSLAQLYADVGVFFSRDARTSWSGPQLPANVPGAAVSLLPLLGLSNAFVYNVWDRAMADGFNGGLPNMSGSGHTAFGYGSAVAGPDSHYQNDARLCGVSYCSNGDAQALGPWERLQYGSSRIGSGTVAVSAGTTVGEVRIVSIPASGGFTAGVGAPLPFGTNAVRFATGSSVIGLQRRVRLSLRVDDAAIFDSFGCFQLNGDAFGGDAGGFQAGQDHPWRYAVPAHVALHSCLYLRQQGLDIAPGGGALSYSIDWANLSTRSMTSVQLTETLDMANLSYVSATPTPTSVALPVLTWDLGDVSAGGGGTIQVDVQVRATAPGTFTRSVAAMSTTDLVEQAEAPVVTQLDPAPFLVSSKTVTPVSTPVGSTVTYSVILTNTGQAATLPLSPIVITDTLPAGFSYVPSTAIVDAGPGCVFAPTQIEPVGMTWTLPLPNGLCAGDTLSLTFDVLVGAVPPGVYENQIEYSHADPGGGAPTFAGFVGLAPLTVDGPSYADVSLTTTDPNGAPLEPGDALCYTVMMQNQVVATNVDVTVPIPALTVFELARVDSDGGQASYSASGVSGPWTYSPGSPTDPAVTHVRFSWATTVAAINAPTFCVIVDTPLRDRSEIITQAFVTTADTGPYQFLSDDIATAEIPDPTARLVTSGSDFTGSPKVADVATAGAGTTIRFTIQVTDIGKGTTGATNVLVTDTVDRSLLENIVLGPMPPGAWGRFADPVITWHIAAIPPSGRVDLWFQADVVTPVPPGTTQITNSATIRFDQDPTPVPTTTAIVNLSAVDFTSSTKTADRGQAFPGTSILYTITVTESAAAGNATNVVVTDVIDTTKLENIVLLPAPPGVVPQWSEPTITWMIPSMGPGASIDLRFTADVIVGATGVVQNAASIGSDDLPASISTGTVDVIIDGSCSSTPPAMAALLGVKSGLASTWTWQQEAGALAGYRLYSTRLRATLPPDSAPRVLECSSSDPVVATCDDADGNDPAQADRLLYYQVVGLCAGEGGF